MDRFSQLFVTTRRKILKNTQVVLYLDSHCHGERIPFTLEPQGSAAVFKMDGQCVFGEAGFDRHAAMAVVAEGSQDPSAEDIYNLATEDSF